MIALLIVTLALAGGGALALVFLGDQLVADTADADPHAHVDVEALFQADARRTDVAQ